MTLVHCPECETQVSARAVACPHCGYPFTSEVPVLARHAEAKSPAPRSYVTTRFALAATAVLFLTGVFAFAGTDEEGLAVMSGLLAWGSAIPIWWKTRKAARDQAVASHTDRRLQLQLQEMEDRLHRELGEVESNTRRVTDLEERLEFTERLLTKYRDNQLGSGN